MTGVRRREGGLQLTEAQRSYLAALVDNEGIWDPRYGGPKLRFSRIGLTYDRAACRAVVMAADREHGP
jgi:hypothetical protein